MSFRYHWEDFPQGWTYESPGRSLTEDEIVAFASEHDPQRYHTDAAAARSSPFGGLIASGWHTATVAMRLMCDGYLTASSCIGSPGIDELRFLRPVRPGDTLRYRATVLEARPSASKPDRGTVKWSWEVLNQADEVVLSMIGVQFFLRRPG